jgi:hypothetical protein
MSRIGQNIQTEPSIQFYCILYYIAYNQSSLFAEIRFQSPPPSSTTTTCREKWKFSNKLLSPKTRVSVFSAFRSFVQTLWRGLQLREHHAVWLDNLFELSNILTLLGTEVSEWCTFVPGATQLIC